MGRKHKGVTWQDLGNYSSQNLILGEGVCSSGWYWSYFVQAILFLSLPAAVRSTIWRVGLAGGPGGVYPTDKYGWDRGFVSENLYRGLLRRGPPPKA